MIIGNNLEDTKKENKNKKPQKPTFRVNSEYSLESMFIINH